MRTKPVEHAAFSVQQLDTAWRWRIYGDDGVVLGEGLEPTRQAAERCALFAFVGADAQHRAA